MSGKINYYGFWVYWPTGTIKGSHLDRIHDILEKYLGWEGSGTGPFILSAEARTKVKNKTPVIRSDVSYGCRAKYSDRVVKAYIEVMNYIKANKLKNITIELVKEDYKGYRNISFPQLVKDLKR